MHTVLHAQVLCICVRPPQRLPKITNKTTRKPVHGLWPIHDLFMFCKPSISSLRLPMLHLAHRTPLKAQRKLHGSPGVDGRVFFGHNTTNGVIVFYPVVILTCVGSLNLLHNKKSLFLSSSGVSEN